MEGVRRVAAVGAGVGERPDHVEELDDRARPPVGEHDRQSIGLGRSHVQEVDVLPVDGGDELRELVEAGLVVAPVVGVAPIRQLRPASSVRHHPVWGSAPGTALREPLVRVVQHVLGTSTRNSSTDAVMCAGREPVPRRTALVEQVSDSLAFSGVQRSAVSNC
jgi:hypothetical protein